MRVSIAACPPLVDTHAHLQDSIYDHDRDEVLARAEVAGLRAIVCVGYDLASSRRAVELAAAHEPVYAAVGVHPNYASQAAESDWPELCSLARQPKAVALGETGLDNYRKYTPPEVQETWFRRHLALADELGLPLIVHNRSADERVRSLLADWTAATSGRRGPGVMHCFSGGLEMLEACLGLGFTISFAGPITFKNAGALRQVAEQVPAERLVVETDCPFLAPHPHRGQRNEPAYLEYTVRQLAELRGEQIDQLAESTTRAAAALFRLRLPLEQKASRS
jgi:TatD DNase family protein